MYLLLLALAEPNKDIQKLLKSSNSGDLSKELFQHQTGGEDEEEEGGLSGHTASLLHIAERRREYTRGKDKQANGGRMDPNINNINTRAGIGIGSMERWDQ